jgi:hypothetical protein
MAVMAWKLWTYDTSTALPPDFLNATLAEWYTNNGIGESD